MSGQLREVGGTDPLSIVRASPDAVKQHDKVRWLALFAPDATIEDPVGAGVHVGLDRISAFWDVYIQPNDVTFHARRDFVAGDHVVRYVSISTVTPVDPAPFTIPAIIEYRVADGRLASLRAFWEPKHAVIWHAKHGLRGIRGLTVHGMRMTRGLGLSAGLAFGRAMRPSAHRELGERIAASLSSRDAWLDLTKHAAVDVTKGAQHASDPASAWERILSDAPALSPEEILVAGDHVACVLSNGERAAAVIAREDRGELAALRMLWS